MSKQNQEIMLSEISSKFSNVFDEPAQPFIFKPKSEAGFRLNQDDIVYSSKLYYMGHHKP